MGHEPRTDPLDTVHRRRPSGEHRRARRLHGDDADRAQLLLQHRTDSRDRAAGAHTRDEGIQAAVGGLEDLAGRRLAVCSRVGRVVELLRHEVGVRIGGDDLFGAGDGAGHVLGGRRQFDARAVGGHHRDPLAAHVVGHRQHQVIPPRRRHHGQGDAGVARGGLHDRHARSQLAVCLGGQDHAQTDSILDAASRVEGLQLAQDAGRAGRRQAPKRDQRRVAHRIQNRVHRDGRLAFSHRRRRRRHGRRRQACPYPAACA